MFRLGAFGLGAFFRLGAFWARAFSVWRRTPRPRAKTGDRPCYRRSGEARRFPVIAAPARAPLGWNHPSGARAKSKRRSKFRSRKPVDFRGTRPSRRAERDADAYAASSAERSKSAGTLPPMMSSKTRTRPLASSRSREPIAVAKGPVFTRTD